MLCFLNIYGNDRRGNGPMIHIDDMKHYMIHQREREEVVF